MKSVIIIGASGHGKVVADIVQKSGDRVFGFLDNNTKLSDKFIGIPILGKIEKYKDYIDEAEFIIAIGNSEIREKIANMFKDVRWYTAVHPTAVISNIDVNIGEGTVVMANAVINSGTIISRHCIINSGAIVEHDNHIEEFVHVSVGVRIAGNVYVGRKTWIGIGTSISNNLKICDNCVIGAGTVVVTNIEQVGTYVGVPAKNIISKKETNIMSEYQGGG